MRIGVTNLFKGSAFGSALPQVALYLATALSSAGHKVSFIIPSESDEWFVDCASCNTEAIPIIKLVEGVSLEIFDLVVEVVWFLPAALRPQIAKKVVMFYHYAPVFYDIESSTYPLATQVRDFTGIFGLWTWGHFKATDYAYLEFMSRRPVFKCPFFWNPMLLDSYIAETELPPIESIYCSGSKKQVVICESNQTNTSNCTLPLVILSELYKADNTIKWSVLNSEELSKREFFMSNVVKNLHIANSVDISGGTDRFNGNFLKRVRLPDLRREPNYIISHQRFRPIKYMLLDALYLGIPLVHNCELLASFGKYYELNRIGQAVSAFHSLPDVTSSLSAAASSIVERFGPAVGSAAIAGLLLSTLNYVAPIAPVRPSVRIAFLDMWADFKPSHNLFLEAFAQNGFSVVNDQNDPTVIIFGPFGNDNTNPKWALTPKVFYTGENVALPVRKDVVLHTGFTAGSSVKNIRLPNWFLELNWYNQDPALINNPMPFPLDLLVCEQKQTQRSKFCIFVASNPACVERNTLFHTVCRYADVDSRGTLFNNCEQIPAGAGGSGGQMAKVEAYRAYKFALVCENASAPGYVTEKLLHAKLAGCVPIYWGSADVSADFDPAGYINVADYKTADLLLARIAELDKDHAAWSAMASVPALSAARLDECRSTLQSFCSAVMDIKPLMPVAGAVGAVAAVGAGAVDAFKEKKKIPSYDLTHIKEAAPKVIVTCCNGKFISSALKLLKSSPVPVYVWVWDVDFMDVKKLTKAGAAQVIPLDTKWNPHWADFWNPAHYAWKSLVMVLANSCLPAGTHVLYLDAGVEVVGDLAAIWTGVTADSFFICKMPEHKMRTWCHPTFCSTLSVTEAEMNEAQVSANIVGFTVGAEKATSVLSQVLGLACNPDVIVGHKWHAYSEVCKGHRHDQSILSLVCIRSGINQHLLDDYAGWQSREAAVASGAVLYVHRGATAPTGPTAGNKSPSEMKGITDSFVVNLEHRKDRLEQFFHNQPYMKCKRLDAINGRTLTLNKDICRLFMNNDFKWKKSVMGCALSHFGLWKHIAETSGSYLILEDDAVLCADFVGKWNSIVGLKPADADIIFLGGVLPPNKPALPMVTEPVNAAFARVAINNVFGSRRRYFHFCTYSYIITTAGAQKLCRLIAERGLYTSADHMLVNNMDLLNVYFTTPLLAGCVQDSDPVYQKADFNNFERVDKFDSEIWNNTDAFTQEEIAAASTVVAALKPLTVIYFEEEQQKQCIDSQWLRAIFQRDFLWTSVSDASTSVSDASNSEVLLYYQHTTPVSVIEGWINRNADRTIYLLHASDESCTADVSLYRHPSVKCVFRNYWRPDVCGNPKVVTLPLGYLDNKGLSGSLVIASGRLYDWSFAGATDRPGRLEALAAIKKWAVYPKHKLHLTPTWGSSANLDAAAYAAILQQSRFVPCLDGFYNTESYRFYEALEAGCVPVICADEKETYKNILGAAPLVTVSSWSSPMVISDWNDKQKELFSWWQSFKQSLSALVQSKFV